MYDTIALYSLLITYIYFNTEKYREKLWYKIKKIFRPFLINMGVYSVGRKTRSRAEGITSRVTDSTDKNRREEESDTGDEGGREGNVSANSTNRTRKGNIERIERTGRDFG